MDKLYLWKFNFKGRFIEKFSLLSKMRIHHKISCEERFKLTFDRGEYEIIECGTPPDDPIKFSDSSPIKIE